MTFQRPDVMKDWAQPKSETDWQGKFVAAVNQTQSGFAFSLVPSKAQRGTGARMRKGLPDIYVAHNYFCGHIEFKIDTKVSAMQKYCIDELNKSHPFNAVVLKWPWFILNSDEELILEIQDCPLVTHESKPKDHRGFASRVLRVLRNLRDRYDLDYIDAKGEPTKEKG